MEELTKENYATNHDYVSFTRISKYLECEAAANANYKKEQTESMLVGSYVDAHFSGELPQFVEEHPEIINSRTGELKKDFKLADEIIQRIESDELFMYYMNGENQKIMTGDICGVPFKIKMDSYKEGEFIADLKVVKSFDKVWSDVFRSKVTFVENFNYDIELAIFQEIVRQNTGKVLPCYILAVTKQSPSDINIYQLNQGMLDNALNIVKNYLPRYQKIKDKKIAASRCEVCDYCRKTKKAKIYDVKYIGVNGDKLREDGFDCTDPIIKEENNALEKSC